MAAVQYFVVAVGVVVVLLYFARRYFDGGVFKSSKRLDGKTVVITGANTGIGKETAVNLAARGARVIIACRDKHKGSLALQDIRERSNSQQVYLEHLDLASFKSVRDFAEKIKKTENKLHILINNAGIAMGINDIQFTEDGFEMTFGVNHLGHFLLTNLLLDLLLKSAPSRIVNVSSDAHRLIKIPKLTIDEINKRESFSAFTAYCNSKLANVLFTRELAKRLEGTGVTCYALHPGFVQTEVFRRAPWFYAVLINIAGHLTAKSPKQGAQTTLYCSVTGELEGVSGKYYVDCTEKQLEPHAKDDDAARKLWEVSTEYVGL